MTTRFIPPLEYPLWYTVRKLFLKKFADMWGRIFPIVVWRSSWPLCFSQPFGWSPIRWRRGTCFTPTLAAQRQQTGNFCLVSGSLPLSQRSKRAVYLREMGSLRTRSCNPDRLFKICFLSFLKMYGIHLQVQPEEVFLYKWVELSIYCDMWQILRMN